MKCDKEDSLLFISGNIEIDFHMLKNGQRRPQLNGERREDAQIIRSLYQMENGQFFSKRFMAVVDEILCLSDPLSELK